MKLRRHREDPKKPVSMPAGRDYTPVRGAKKNEAVLQNITKHSRLDKRFTKREMGEC